MQNRTIQLMKPVLLSSALLLGLALSAQSFAASEIRIQRYDSNGNVIGVDRAGTAGTTGTTARRDNGPDIGIEPQGVLVAGSASQIRSAVQALGFAVTGSDELPRLDITVAEIAVPGNRTARDVLAVLRQKAPGLISDYNHLFAEAVGSVDSPRSFMGWPRSTAQCGAGTLIGMIDGSVDATHPAFKSSDLVVESFIGNRHNPGSHDHGTAVASILVGGPDWGGILPGAKLFAANIFYEKQDGKRAASARALTQSLNWLLDNRVQVINLSIAGPDNAVIRKIVEAAARRGIVMVAAAGNGGRSAAPAFPAAY
ncbi:MAG: S8 family serine peptidase, partial [Rhodospirillales bacterium]